MLPTSCFGSIARGRVTQHTRDNPSRITAIAEITQAGTRAFSYTYDIAGRLSSARVNGALRA